MGNQLVTIAELEGITTNFTTTVNVFTAQVTKLTTQVNNNVNNNNNINNNNENNPNRGEGPIRVPHGGNNQIIEDSSSEVEKFLTEEGDNKGITMIVA